jgi:hypothetical protein
MCVWTRYVYSCTVGGYESWGIPTKNVAMKCIRGVHSRLGKPRSRVPYRLHG